MGMGGLNCGCSLRFTANTISLDREVDALILKAPLWTRRGKAFDHYASGFEVVDLMVGAVSHEDGLAEESDESTGLVGEPPVGGLVPVDDQVVSRVAFGAENRRFQPAWEGVERQFAHGVGAGTNRCNLQVHLFRRLSPGLSRERTGGLRFMDDSLRLNADGALVDRYRR